MEYNPSEELGINLAAICNIPRSFHSADLRNYFSQIIEEEAFSCFHFKHRPEVKRGGVSAKEISDTCVCVVSLTNSEALDKLVAYDANNWINKSGEYLKETCKIVKLSVNITESLNQQKYQTKSDKKYKSRHAPVEEFSRTDLQNLSELNPPLQVMPNGNVGTPIAVFLKLIQKCELPSSVIKKLGLVFPSNGSHRRYGNVPYLYEEGTELLPSVKDVQYTVTTANGITILPNADVEMSQKSHQSNCPDVSETRENDTEEKKDSDSDDDDDTCEEWERHEAFHNDVTSQERDKERLFEEEIELKWEKGGSGLVFYTDAQYWVEEDGDFDEQNTDQWDVDTSEFYGNDGDRDAKDFVQICKEKRLHMGRPLLSKRKDKKQHQPSKTQENYNIPVGQFETHTRGIGRKIMEKFGWRDDEGLGIFGKCGITEPIVAEGQGPYQRKGLGFHGENILNSVDPKCSGKKYAAKVQVKQLSGPDNPVTHKAVEPLASHSYLFPQFRSNLVSVSSKHKSLSKERRKKAVPGMDGVIITTKYDVPLDIDKDSGYLRSQHPYGLKHNTVKSCTSGDLAPEKNRTMLASTSKLVNHPSQINLNDGVSLPCSKSEGPVAFIPRMHFVRPASESEWTVFSK